MRTLETYFFSGDEETYTTIDLAAAVDASTPGVGLVTITASDHGFKAGASVSKPTCVYVSGTTNYDGLRRIHAVATNTITIYAKYVAETFAGTETVRTMFTDSKPFNIVGFVLHLDAASATSENLTVNVDADMGAAWDSNLYTKDMNTIKDIVQIYDTPIVCKMNDKVDFVWSNTNNKLWGISVIVEHRV